MNRGHWRACRAWGAVLLLAAPIALAAQGSDQVAVAAPGARAQSLRLSSSAQLVAATWVAERSGRATVMAAVSQDGARRFAAAQVLGDLAPGAASGSVASVVTAGEAGSKGTASVRVAWPAVSNGRHGVMLARSPDGGRSFTQTFVAPKALPAAARAAALAFDGRGRAHVLWLAGSQLLYGRADDRTLEGPRVLDGSASRCGIAAIAAGPGDALAVFWHRRFGERDDEFAFVSSETGGAAFGSVTRVSRENWGFRECPAASPSLTVDGSGALRFVFQAAVGTPAQSTFFVDRTTDRRTFRPRTFLDAPGFTEVRHPVVAPDGEGGLSLVWDGMRNGRRYVVIRHSLGAPGVTSGIDADWMRPSPPIVLDQSGLGGSAFVTRGPAGMLAGWIASSGDGPRVTVRRLTIDELCGLPQ
jgi:hypothetical protein